MSATPECPERATVETLRGEMETGDVVECRTEATAESGAVQFLTVELDGHTLTVPEDEAEIPKAEPP